MKTCFTCKCSKEDKEFYKDSKKKDSLNSNCIECYRKRYDENSYDNFLKRNYNITKEFLNKKIEEQNNRCEICDKEFIPYTDKTGRMYPGYCVDHNHNSGKMRGIICPHCNKVLGFALDDLTIIGKVSAYIKKHMS